MSATATRPKSSATKARKPAVTKSAATNGKPTTPKRAKATPKPETPKSSGRNPAFPSPGAKRFCTRVGHVGRNPLPFSDDTYFTIRKGNGRAFGWCKACESAAREQKKAKTWTSNLLQRNPEAYERRAERYAERAQAAETPAPTPAPKKSAPKPAPKSARKPAPKGAKAGK
jgi:hypothetical protein